MQLADVEQLRCHYLLQDVLDGAEAEPLLPELNILASKRMLARLQVHALNSKR